MQPDENTIQEIVDLEWEMFHHVNEDREKAACQEDRPTFNGMRSAQYRAWDQETASRYLQDLQAAKAQGRNLPMEKYIHMMRFTVPEEYAQLRHRLPPPDSRAETLADAITAKLVSQTALLKTRYPQVSKTGRPLRAEEDRPDRPSIETYQRGELYTYSAATLEALYAHLLALEQKGVSLARQILENTVRYYGFPTLEAAEIACRPLQG